MNEIKPGDVVVLKSGGPSMTVEKVGVYSDNVKKATCTWFEGTTKNTDLIAVIALELDEE